MYTRERQSVREKWTRGGHSLIGYLGRIFWALPHCRLEQPLGHRGYETEGWLLL